MEDVKQFIRESGLSDADLAGRYGFDRSYWTHLRLGTKQMGRPCAIRVFRRDGVKLGPIASATDEEIEVLERFQGAA